MLSDQARRFFEVEIRNEHEGGASPATLGSATDSAHQAPTDVLADWMGLMPLSDESAVVAVESLRLELGRLQDRFGSGFRLQELLDLAHQQPLHFTCPTCGSPELEEVQTGVVIVSRVVGRLPGEGLFIYGDRADLANEATPFYRCAACKLHVADDPQEMHKVLDEVPFEAGKGTP